MYSVVYLDHDNTLERTLFRSHLERDCWNFVRNRLTHVRQEIRETALGLFVRDTLGEFRDPPEDIKSIVRYNKNTAA